MVLVILNFNGDNYDVSSVGTNVNDYNILLGNQKIITVEEWPTTGEWRKKELSWDDKNKKLSKKLT